MSRRTPRNTWKEFPTEELVEAAGQLNQFLKVASPVDRADLEKDGRRIARALDRRRIRAQQKMSLKEWATAVRERQAEGKKHDLSAHASTAGHPRMGSKAKKD